MISRRRLVPLRTCFTLLAPALLHAAGTAPATLGRYCFTCHGKSAAGGLNLQQLAAAPGVGEHFQHWEKAATALEQKRMPPKAMPQPSDAERRETVDWIRARLSEEARKNAGDPGRVPVRRLTSGEYAYTIRDLTGLDWKVEADSGTDSVGGEGFTNFADVQFVQDAVMERYLESAKKIAEHAVIGAGKLTFFDDPGKSGFELSAVARIQDIYRAHGFRSVAGEGGKPYGLDIYGRGFYAAWRYQHRASLGEPQATLASIAKREKVPAAFVAHLWSVVNRPQPTYPTSEVVKRFRNLPADEAGARAGAVELQNFVIGWPRWLFAAGEAAAGGDGDERSLLITEASLAATPQHSFRFFMRGGKKTGRIHLSVKSATGDTAGDAVVYWRNPMLRFRHREKPSDPQPLRSLIDEASAARVKFTGNDFTTTGDTAVYFDIAVPDGAFGVSLEVQAELASPTAVLRAILTDREEAAKGRPFLALLADPTNPKYTSWKAGVLEYAAALPQNSHGEPTPSDKDPIPPPFNNTYNQPERDHFHVKLKYYRTDSFLYTRILDEKTRARLDEAWNDVLASFEYHNAFLRFIEQKYKPALHGKSIGDLTAADISALPADARPHVASLKASFDSVQKAQAAGRTRHLNDVLDFASRAWRRPLTPAEQNRLRTFYQDLRRSSGLDHSSAIRAVLARVLVSPVFLYRLEQPAPLAAERKLSDWEMASRLSYFFWSSAPDDELRRAATARELSTPEGLNKQGRRMLADAKARRFAAEFFGQWLGFYRFDQYRGVDTARFPEFTDEVKSSMYDEAVSFFEHIVRNDRPAREMLSADYTFVNQPLAKHYGIKEPVRSARAMERLDNARAHQRGGLMRLGAVLTATSAPLRTSPVKRGDWVLRRILGTPTPPPPPDAGSIPADEKAFGGLSLFERLEQHKRNPTCAGCHTRIDPLGFPLERYDAVGRWREKYHDGKPVHDSAELANQTKLSGIDGLIEYLQSQEKQVLRTMSAKLLGYALGRTVLASDQPLIDEMVAGGGNATLSQLASRIVTSRQFRHRRESDAAPAAPPPVQTNGQPLKNNVKEGGL